MKDHIPSVVLLEWCKDYVKGESDTKVQRMIKTEMIRRDFEFKRDSTIESRQRRWIKKQK
jgi:hypothetical protein